MIFQTVIAILVLLFLFRLYMRYQNAQRLMKKFRVPPHHPLTGCLLYFPRDFVDVFQHILDYFRHYGKNLVMLGVGYEVILYVSNPDDMENILAKSNPKLMKKATDYDYLNRWLGTGLLTGWGEKWFQRRKIIAPSFHLNVLEEFVSIFSKQSSIFIQKLDTYAGKGDFDLYYPVRLFALDVVCETAMGIELNSQSQPESTYVNAVKDMTEILHRNFFSIIRQIPFLYYMTKTGRRELALIRSIHNFTTDVIRKRRDILLHEMANDKAFHNRKKQNLLDILLQANIDGRSLSNAEIREEVDTFMFAGHDTSTSAIALTIYLLAKQKKVQDKLYDELVAYFGDERSPQLTQNDLNELKYLEMVIKESLRLFPPVPLIGRHLKEDTIIEGTVIPRDTNIILGIYPMHHSPDYYPYPEKFCPERFDPNNQQTWPKGAYIPFSVGPRNCIGQKFAMLEMKCILAKLVLNYEIMPANCHDDIRLQADITLKSANGVYVQIKRRLSNVVD